MKKLLLMNMAIFLAIAVFGQKERKDIEEKYKWDLSLFSVTFRGIYLSDFLQVPVRYILLMDYQHYKLHRSSPLALHKNNLQ